MNDSPAGIQQIVYRFERLDSLTGWWTWAAIILAIIVAFVLVVRLYRRDTCELPRATGITMMMLRCSILLALVFFFLNFERRSQQKVTRPSEIVALIDTSQSMSLPTNSAPDSSSRIQAVAALLQDTPLLQDLSEEHRVVVYGFDESPELRELASFRPPESSIVPDNRPDDAARFDWNGFALAGTSILAFGVLGLVISAIVPLLGWQWASGLILASAISVLLGGVTLSSAWSVNTSLSLRELLGGTSTSAASDSTTDTSETEDSSKPLITWSDSLVASGSSSRIGDSVRSVLTRHDPSTLAGILLLTDGQSNAGIPLEDAAAFAAREGVSLYPVGFGSPNPPANVRIVDLQVPRRVYPGDRFAVSVVLQATGLSGKTVDIEVLEGPDGDTPPSEVIDTKKVMLDEDGKLTGVQFDLDPPSIGARRIQVQLRLTTADRNKDDNLQDARYEVVSRKVRVLLLAGGPTREYRFVRNLLHRDRDVSVDVMLQTGQQGMSQDADNILEEFPSSPDDLFEYDGIIAFDPDWLALEAAQIDLLDRWLSDMAGGLILVAGPVYLPEWSRLRGDLRATTIKGFFPVSIAGRGPIIDTGRQGGTTPWPLKFTPDGERSAFLALTDDVATSAAVWQDFSGVFDFIGAKDPKPGAKVHAFFSDPTASVDGRLPIYLASQLYGSGRTFFQGSGEMWRLRAVSDSYFEAYYTKLVRWATEGRLLRDSTRGVLIVDKPRAMVGEPINVRAKLLDAQFQPLLTKKVTAELVLPSGEIQQEITLRPLEGQPTPGNYSGQFSAERSGSFEVRLMLGDALDEQILRQPVQINLPTLELERPQRNDSQLRAIAAVTEGEFVSGSQEPDDIESDSMPAQPGELAASIQPRPQTTVLPGTPDRDFHRRRNASLIWLLGAALTLEWLLRRLNRLA